MAGRHAEMVARRGPDGGQGLRRAGMATGVRSGSCVAFFFFSLDASWVGVGVVAVFAFPRFEPGQWTLLDPLVAPPLHTGVF